MNSLRKYMNLMNKMLWFRSINDEKKEEETLNEMDKHWYEQVDTLTRKAIENIVWLDSKEKYIAVKTSWKKYIADGKHRRYKVPHAVFRWLNGEYIKEEGYYFWRSDLQLAHHVVYAILRNKKLNKMFNKNTNSNMLLGVVVLLQSVVNGNKSSLDYINKPFGNLLTKEDIANILKRFLEIKAKTNIFAQLDLE